MIFSNFYVDDLLKSVSNKEQALSVLQDVTELCSNGGFRLTKWISNIRDVIQTVPVEEKAKELKALDMMKDDLSVGRALGPRWGLELLDKMHYHLDVVYFPLLVRCQRLESRHYLSLQRWTHWSGFLWNPMSAWPIQPPAISTPSDDPELKASVNITVESQESPMERLMLNFSNWLKLKNTVAWLMLAKRCL